MFSILAAFFRSRGGNIALITAIALPVLLAGVGAAVDIGYAYSAKSRLDDAADAAALASISRQSVANNPGGLTNITGLQAIGSKFFTANATTLTNLTVNSVNVQITTTTTTATSTVAYVATVKTFFAGILGRPTISIAGQSTTTINVPAYIDFYLLLDNSMSMALGATTTDITNLTNATGGCAFGCHDLSNSNSNYNIAKNIGVTMRIDVLRSAVQQLMTTAANDETMTNQFRMAIYDYGTTGVPVQTLNPIWGLSSNLAGAASAAASLDVMTMWGQNLSNTLQSQFDVLLPQINAAIPNPGTGTATAPQKILFFITDGVTDEPYNANCINTNYGGACQGPINPNLCTAIKARGISIAILYTTYLPIAGNSQYIATIQPYNNGPWAPSPNSQIAANLQTCASPSLYFEVGPNQGISQALTQLFEKSIAGERIAS